MRLQRLRSLFWWEFKGNSRFRTTLILVKFLHIAALIISGFFLCKVHILQLREISSFLLRKHSQQKKNCPVIALYMAAYGLHFMYDALIDLGWFIAIQKLALVRSLSMQSPLNMAMLNDKVDVVASALLMIRSNIIWCNFMLNIHLPCKNYAIMR